ncbi:MAG: tetratricopeptide repeat protein [Gemmatimonadetes bacterium]|nr:tetratricopeptide repeat protein [Gemmatimonadota bacterium]
MRRPIFGLSAALFTILLLAGSASAQSALSNCKYYTKVSQDFEGGLNYCRQCIEDEPDNPEARYYGAWCLAETGNYEEAWESFNWLIERKDTRNKKMRKHAQWAEERVQRFYARHFNAGVKALNEDDLLTANTEFERAVEIYPTKAGGLLNYGFTQNKLGDTDAAIESFRRAVELNPDDPTAYEYLSVALSSKVSKLREDPADSTKVQELETELQDVLTRVLEAKPSNDAAMLQLADLELAKGNRESAFQYIEKAYDIDPTNLNKLYNIGVSFFEAPNYEAAAEAFGKTAELLGDPDDSLWADAMYNKSLCEQKLERWDVAISTAQKLVAESEGNADYHRLLADAYTGKGDRPAAMKEIQMALDLEKNSAEGEAP